ncbi:MAG: DUF4199 domain-containing protein [Bacteroidota bacterium]|nr:DUF4199 domain-containing protein [Bacteroidota bacterium]
MDKTKLLRSVFSGGAVLAAIFIVYGMLLYVLEVNYFSIGFGILNFVIMAVIFASVMLVFGKKIRNTLFEGYMSYGQAFAYTLALGILGGVFIAIFNFFFYEFVDLSYLDNQASEFLYKMEQRGLSEEQLQDIREKVSKELHGPSWKKSLKGLMNNSIIAVIFSLIISIFVKQNKAYEASEL